MTIAPLIFCKVGSSKCEQKNMQALNKKKTESSFFLITLCHFALFLKLF